MTRDRASVLALTFIAGGVLGAGALYTALRFLHFQTASDEFAWFAAVFAGVSCVLIAAQILLAFQQLDLQNREIDLVEQQGKILERQDELLHQRARLIVWATVSHLAPVSAIVLGTAIEFTILNVGDRTARAATLELLMPSSADRYPHRAQPEWYETPDIQGNSRWRIDLERYFFVDIPVKLAARLDLTYRLSVAGTLVNDIKWRIAFEDGVEPARGEWEPLTTREAIADKYRAFLDRAGPLSAP